MHNLPLIKFKCPVGIIKINKEGYLIGQYLAVAPSIDDKVKYQIFSLHNGKRDSVYGKLLVSASFVCLDDAIEIAKWLDETYRDFFPIWDVYPEADVFAISKWTVRNGIQIYEFLDILKGRQSVNKTVLSGAYINAEERVKEWTRQ